MSIISNIEHQLTINAKFNQEEAKRFFKTDKNSYASHDQFLGVPVPALRKISKIYAKEISFAEIGLLLKSPYNEKRLLALFMLIAKYSRSSEYEKYSICKFYLHNLEYVNNWNLVDSSAYQILGNYLLDKDKTILLYLAQSNDLWHRRISVVSTMAFIKNNELQPTIQIAEILLKDEEDLIHKATGWMLREVGKKDEKLLVNFIEKNDYNMPRVMFRYATEKLASLRGFEPLLPP